MSCLKMAYVEVTSLCNWLTASVRFNISLVTFSSWFCRRWMESVCFWSWKHTDKRYWAVRQSHQILTGIHCASVNCSCSDRVNTSWPALRPCGRCSAVWWWFYWTLAASLPSAYGTWTRQIQKPQRVSNLHKVNQGWSQTDRHIKKLCKKLDKTKLYIFSTWDQFQSTKFFFGWLQL